MPRTLCACVATIRREIRREGLTWRYAVPTNPMLASGLVGAAPADRASRIVLSVSPAIGTIEHVFGPSLEQIARKWREMATPKSDGEKTMLAHELSPVSDDTTPAAPEASRD
jgi:hypothetical protein